MRTSRRNVKRLTVAVAAVLLCLYVVFSAVRKKYESEVLVRHMKPKMVWLFVADYRNIQTLLNPGIFSLMITKYSNNTHHWHYGVEYLKRQSHWPYWLNKSTTHIWLSGTSGIDTETEPAQYVIKSEHQTCYLRGLYCLNSIGTFTFLAREPDTLCKQAISYECPSFLSSVCRGEVEFQSNAIMSKLAGYFANNSKLHINCH